MSLFYRIACLIGITPWRHASDTHTHRIAPFLDGKVTSNACSKDGSAVCSGLC